MHPSFVAAVLFAGCPAKTPDEGSFSVLTYNVQGLPDALSDSERPTADRMMDISPMLAAFDLVGVQEDFDEDWHDLLVADAPHALQPWFGDPLDGRVYGSGLGQLAGIGVEETYEEHYYDDCHGTLDGGSDCLASKGFQALILDLGDGATLAFLNTHHEAGGDAEDDYARDQQVAAVVGWIDDHPEHAILFVGDLNLRPSDPEDVPGLQAYADAGLRDACGEVACPETDHIDRIQLRDSDRLALDATGWAREERFVGADGLDLSDHPAISASVVWSRTD